VGRRAGLSRVSLPGESLSSDRNGKADSEKNRLLKGRGDTMYLHDFCGKSFVRRINNNNFLRGGQYTPLLGRLARLKNIKRGTCALYKEKFSLDAKEKGEFPPDKGKRSKGASGPQGGLVIYNDITRGKQSGFHTARKESDHSGDSSTYKRGGTLPL